MDKLAQCRLDVFVREISTKADSSGLGEQRLDNRQHGQLPTTVARNR
jgi:hypothetical protein